MSMSRQILNNWDIIVPYLSFDNPDVFWIVQIVQRRKENPDLAKSEIHRGSYFVDSLKYVERKFPEWVDLSKMYNARVYISLAPRSKEAVLHQSLIDITEKLKNNSLSRPWDVSSKAAGNRNTIVTRKVYKSHRTLIDVDSMDDYEKVKTILQEHTKIQLEIPTLNGIHLIVDAFNFKEVKPKRDGFDIQKDCYTLLYAERDI